MEVENILDKSQRIDHCGKGSFKLISAEEIMTPRYPLRPNSHNLETLSQRFFERSLPRNWTSEKPSPDYGVDLRVDIFEGEYATGLELLVQLKSSANASKGEEETVNLQVSTYNYLRDKLQVVMIVKYVEKVDEAYWILIKDVPEPDQEQQSFTVHIPKENTLSTISWNQIQNYIQQVTDKKLAARRRRQLQQI
jgi:hypothetical protein